MPLDNPAFMVTDLPAADGTILTVSINGGDTIECARTSVDREKLMMPQGTEDFYRFSIYIQASRFIDRPEVDDEAVLSDTPNETFDILAVVVDPANQLLRLDVGQENTMIPPIR